MSLVRSNRVYDSGLLEGGICEPSVLETEFNFELSFLETAFVPGLLKNGIHEPSASRSGISFKSSFL